MSVPQHIREVPRPVNPVVVDNKRDGPNRWAVRAGAGNVYDKETKTIRPVNGKTTGHICDGVFVPITEAERGEDGSVPETNQDEGETSAIETEAKIPCHKVAGYGASALVKKFSDDLIEDLKKVFPLKMAYTVIVIAMLRVIIPDIPDDRLKTYYEKTFLQVFYPGIPLSASIARKIMTEAGQNDLQRWKFFKQRIDRVAESHHIVISGMLVNGSSRIHDLSQYTAGSKANGRKQMSILYAYDLAKNEPVCAEVFPGNYVDSNAYEPFILRNNIERGLLICDKGLLPGKIEQLLKERPGLHYLTPLKRNDIRITNNNMLEFQGILEYKGKTTGYKKCRMQNGKYLYSFIDPEKANGENINYFECAGKRGSFDSLDYEKRRVSFGTTVFESDLDIEPLAAYQCYMDKWFFELLFDTYKNGLDLDDTGEPSDCTVIGSEFVNCLSAVITSRIINFGNQKHIFDECTFESIMTDLRETWRYIDAPLPPISNDGHWFSTPLEMFPLLEQFELSRPSQGLNTAQSNGKKTKPSSADTAKGNGADKADSRTETKARGKAASKAWSPGRTSV